MIQLNDNELAVLELLAMSPGSHFPPQVLQYAETLSRSGLAICADGRWFATAAGLRRARRTLH